MTFLTSGILCQYLRSVSLSCMVATNRCFHEDGLRSRQVRISRYPVWAMSSLHWSQENGRKSGMRTMLLGFAGVIVFLVVVFFLARSSDGSETTGMVLYYGQGCPHCAIVDAFVEENNVEEKISFTRKEVYYNKSNAREMARHAKDCGYATDSVGVPFLWTGTTCLTGDKPIIAFFQSQIGGTGASASAR